MNDSVWCIETVDGIDLLHVFNEYEKTKQKNIREQVNEKLFS